MITAIRGLIKKHPVIFGVLVFFGSTLLAMAVINGVGVFYFEIIEPQPSGSWALMSIPAFLFKSSLLILMWSGFTTYFAAKCKPANTATWMAITLFLYGYWFYSFLANVYSN